MIEINNTDGEYNIYGYISMPEVTKSSRNHMITIVNGRVVRNQEVNKTINDSYHTFKPDDRYPIVVLKIDVDTSLVDVNIHPTKQDVKFGKLEELKELISSTISEELKKIRLIPKIENKEYDIPINNIMVNTINNYEDIDEKPS